MIKNDLNECVALLGQILGFVMSSSTSLTSTDGAQLRLNVGALNAKAAQMIAAGTAADALFQCFELARTSGTDIVHMSRARQQIASLSPVSAPAVLLVEMAVELALVEEGKIISATTFTSSNDAQALLVQMQGEFSDAEEAAADRLDSSVYQALISLHASVTNHLVVTAQQLPRIVSYDVNISFPSLRLAQLIYQDGSRADELLNENHTIHPLFMPSSGTALSQ